MGRLRRAEDVMWLLIGVLAAACSGGFMLLQMRIDKEIDMSSGVARVYPRLHR